MADSGEGGHIVVIGGGLLGCYSALFLARTGFKVTLMEKGNHILNGAASVVGHDHEWGLEYPAHRFTGEECTFASRIQERVWGRRVITSGRTFEGINIHTDRKPNIYAVAEHTEQLPEGQGRFTWAEFMNHLKLMEKKDKETIKQTYLVEPERHLKSYKELKSHELKKLNRYFLPLAGAVRSPEHGFDIPKHGSLLEAAIKNAGVEVITNAEVKEIEKKLVIHFEDGTKVSSRIEEVYPGRQLKKIGRKNNDEPLMIEFEGGIEEPLGKSIESYQGRKVERMALDDHFTVYYGKNGEQQTKCDMVSNMAWEGLMAIKNPGDMQLLQGTKVFLRAMGLLDMTGVKDKNIPSIFIMAPGGGKHSGMLQWMNNRCAFGYGVAEGIGRVADITPTDPNSPPKWNSESSKEHQDAYLKWLINGPFPGLEGAKMIKLLIRPLLVRPQGVDGVKLEKRPYFPLDEPIPGLFYGIAEKGIFGAQMGAEKAERAAARWGLIQACRPNDRLPEMATPQTAAQLDPAFSLPLALQGIKLDPRSCARREARFLKERGIPEALLNDVSFELNPRSGRSGGRVR